MHLHSRSAKLLQYYVCSNSFKIHNFCCRLCNIDSISIVEGGTNGWHIDSVLSFGCISGTGCTQITQDIDVNRWVDGNSPIEGRERLTLTKISNTPCAM